MPAPRFCIVSVIWVSLVGSAFAIAAQSASSANCSVSGDLEIIPFTSHVFQNQRNLRVWLPPGYHEAANADHRYPVLYLNDGQNLFDACTSMFNRLEWRVDEAATSLINEHQIPPIIIVGIDNAGKRQRANEYLPFPDETLKPVMNSVHGKQYPQFLLGEVVPFINAHYRTDRRAKNTGLGGSSYGAGIALYTIMQRPGHFGRLLLESPSLYAHDDYLIHQAEKFRRWPDKVYLGVGDVREPKTNVERLRTILAGDGLGNSRLLIVVQHGAAHDEAAWASRFPRALRFLYAEPGSR
jgi:enterochelin esterase-like enzyme